MTPRSRPILEKSRPAVSIRDFKQEELTRRLQKRLSEHENVIEAYLFGSAAANKAGFWSDIDLVIVADTNLPFIERPRQFFDLLEFGIPVDILVYTPDEFVVIKESPSGFWKNFRETHLKLR
jgi:predicted nucleotidyltransferase